MNPTPPKESGRHSMPGSRWGSSRAVVAALVLGCGGQSRDSGVPEVPEDFSVVLTIEPHPAVLETTIPIPERPDFDFAVTVTPADAGTDPALFLCVVDRTLSSVTLRFAPWAQETHWRLDVAVPPPPEVPRL
jgi:hypothetical protein